MRTIYSYTILAIFLIVSACSDEDKVSNNYDCQFVQNDEDMDGWIDETEQAIMETCRENELTSKESIEENLIGNWELIGHGEGWIPTISQPCAFIEIEVSSLVYYYENEFIDTSFMANWEILGEEPDGLYLSVDNSPVQGLTIGTFCEQYMFFNHTPFDGNMFIYEKVD